MRGWHESTILSQSLAVMPLYSYHAAKSILIEENYTWLPQYQGIIRPKQTAACPLTCVSLTTARLFFLRNAQAIPILEE
jgi:hypothetical protein